MYHKDETHSGNASSSDIKSSNVNKLRLLHSIHFKGQILSIPVVADGKIYVGTSFITEDSKPGGSLCKIDLQNGKIELIFNCGPGGFQGITCSPSIVNDNVYFFGGDGILYCLNATDFKPLWSTNLRNPDYLKDQPIQNVSDSDTLSSPLVINGKIYIGTGNGDNPDPKAIGYIYCIDADTGKVNWIFCTCQFTANVKNVPNLIPPSAATDRTKVSSKYAISDHDPPNKGSAIWSGIAYSKVFDRIYVGTSNTYYLVHAEKDLPDPLYGSSVLSLDAKTGELIAFYSLDKTAKYDPSDTDADFAGSPIIFNRQGTEVVGIGNKSGVYYILDANNLKLIAKRQLLSTGTPGTKDNRGNFIPRGPDNTLLPYVDSIPSFGRHTTTFTPHLTMDNDFGIYGTAAIHPESHSLFIGLGRGTDPGVGRDPNSTPFVRCIDINDDNLKDNWPNEKIVIEEHAPNDPKSYYEVSRYVNSKEIYYYLGNPPSVCYGSPAIVNDLCFVSVSYAQSDDDSPRLYAIETGKGDLKSGGTIIWQADLPPSKIRTLLGPAIYKNYVIVGSENYLSIFFLGQ